MVRTFSSVTVSWSLRLVAWPSSALIFDTEIAPITTSASTRAPNAMPRRYASRRLLKRDMLVLRKGVELREHRQGTGIHVIGRSEERLRPVGYKMLPRSRSNAN